MKKIIQFIIFTFACLILSIFQSLAEEKIKIGLLIPVTGEYGKIGQSVINSVRLALNSINDNRIEILPRDTRADPSTTLKIAKELYEVNGVKIIGVKSLMNRLPLTASSLYAKNLFSFIRNLYSKEKKDFNINLEDEIIDKSLIKKV